MAGGFRESQLQMKFLFKQSAEIWLLSLLLNNLFAGFSRLIFVSLFLNKKRQIKTKSIKMMQIENLQQLIWMNRREVLKMGYTLFFCHLHCVTVLTDHLTCSYSYNSILVEDRCSVYDRLIQANRQNKNFAS